MNSIELAITREKEDALLTKDRMRIDVDAEFYVRVAQSKDSVSLAAASQPTLDRLKSNCGQRYKINVKRAIGVVRDDFANLVAIAAESWKEIIEKVSRRMLRAASIVRDGRSAPPPGGA